MHVGWFGGKPAWNLLQIFISWSMTVKELWKLANICQSYDERAYIFDSQRSVNVFCRINTASFINLINLEIPAMAHIVVAIFKLAVHIFFARGMTRADVCAHYTTSWPFLSSLPTSSRRNFAGNSTSGCIMLGLLLMCEYKCQISTDDGWEI